MKIRQPQVVLIAFAVAAWLAAILELGAAASGSGDDCLEHATNCGVTYIDGARQLAPEGCGPVRDSALRSLTACYSAAR